MQRTAAIDIGSQTLRLLVVEKKGPEFRTLFRDREMVRLGQGFHPHRQLTPQAVEKALKVLVRFRERIRQEGADEVRAVATGVLREAKNGQTFLEEVKRTVGIPVRLISGEEEARMTARGVLSIYPEVDGEVVIFDIGGGSTELVRCRQRTWEDVASLPLGVVDLTERFLTTDPPTEAEVQGLREYGRIILRKNFPRHGTLFRLIGTAGTATTLAALFKKTEDYRPEEINGTRLHRRWLEALLEQLLALKVKDRALLKGLEAGRADIIVAGVLLVLEIMDYFNEDFLHISDAGLLEGLILTPEWG